MKYRLRLCIAVLLAAFSICGVGEAAVPPIKDAFATLLQGQVIHGFRSVAIYLNDSDHPMGGRFVHGRTGFTFDLLQIQSVPQAFIWVNTLPVSDRGEPHTQEHLLLGKGSQGREVANLDSMSLVESSAMTMQWRTCYHFNTSAGPEVFYRLIDRRLDAMLHPDYTDEEVRREVRNFGVTQDAASGALRLEEKGTVYNEMVTNVDQPGSRLFREIGLELYGKGHPLSYNSGGMPEGIRELTPAQIREFHRRNYYLGNMGMIGSFPREMAPDGILRRLDGILNRLQDDAPLRPVRAEPAFPPPHPAAAGAIRMVSYPDKNEQQPGTIVYSWPPVRRLDTREEMLLDLFMESLAGDATTNLYKRFVDSRTRIMDVGAKGVSGWASDDEGFPIYIALNGVPPAHLNEREIRQIREKIREELGRIAGWKDGSPDLAEFNSRVRSRLVEQRRGLSKFVNSPPGFGFRWQGSGWMDQLRTLARTGLYRRSVTMKPELAFVDRLLSGRENFWSKYLSRWKMLETIPYAAAVKPDPILVTQEAEERQGRIKAEVARLEQVYGVKEEEQAIRKYRESYDAATARIEALSRKVASPHFVDSPPLTLDDQLDYRSRHLDSGVPLVASTFENMTSATTGIAVRMDGIQEDDLLYLSLLPELLTGVGVIQDGKPISYEQMQERLRKEILGLSASFSSNIRTNRYELVVRGSGNNPMESQRAVDWMKLVLLHPNWRPENLSRIRDLVDQSLTGLRRTRQGYEEHWVENVSDGFRKQDQPIYLAAGSFLTRTHNVQRLRWLLKDVPAARDREAISAYLKKLGAAAQEAMAPGGESANKADASIGSKQASKRESARDSATSIDGAMKTPATAGAEKTTVPVESSKREGLKSLLGGIQGDAALAGRVPASLRPLLAGFQGLPPGARTVLIEAARDLDADLPDIPDATLSEDWADLCREIESDLVVSPAQVLEQLDTLRRGLLKTGRARMFFIGSSGSQEKLEKSLESLARTLDTAPAPTPTVSGKLWITSRLREHDPGNSTPVFIGLVNPNTQGGVIINSAPGVTYSSTDQEAVLRFLAFHLSGGGGEHSIFMKTWAAGLAYNNGLGESPESGRMSYYADNVPEVPQTLRFVIHELKRTPSDPNLGEYAVAQAFYSRAAESYESRGEAMAANLADGVTPEVVRRFRKAILQAKKMPGLTARLVPRAPDEYARILPGFSKTVPEDGLYFVIGPEKEFQIYESYLKSVEGSEVHLYRLYPRDFWMDGRSG